MPKFQVGELCEALNGDGAWVEATIISAPGAMMFKHPVSGKSMQIDDGNYVIEVPSVDDTNGGHFFQCEEPRLRKRRQGREMDRVIPWEECSWWPRSIQADILKKLNKKKMMLEV